MHKITWSVLQLATWSLLATHQGSVQNSWVQAQGAAAVHLPLGMML